MIGLRGRKPGEDSTIMQLPLDCKAWYCENFLRPAEGRALWDAIEATFDLGPTVIETPDGGQLELPHGRFNFADEWIVESDKSEPWGQRKAWIEEIRPVKEKVEAFTGRVFDACVGYYYEDGTVGFSYHYDMPCFDDPSILAAVSLGHERVFSFRHVDDHSDSYDLQVSDGSLIVMGEHCRERYEHGLLVDQSVREPRLVLVFMNFYGDRPE
jgi:alkylated DNA repair dioxygenase AlkB